jgi:hypothetical protein
MTLRHRLHELVTDDVSGNLSSTKAVTLGTWLAATLVVIRSCWNAAPGEGVATVLLTYVGCFAANSVVSKAIAAKWGGAAPLAPTPTPPGGATP